MYRLDSGFSGAITNLCALEDMTLSDTPVHRLHPFVKLAATIVYITVVISFGRYEIGALLPFFFYPAILTPLSDTPYGYVFKRLLPALPFPLFGGISNIIFDRAPMLMFGEFIVTGGMVSFISIMIKTVLSVWAVLLLVSTTGVAGLSRQLSAIGVPNIMVLQFVLTYRYLSVLIKEARTMFASYILRSNGAKGIQMRDMGTFLGVMLLHSIDRADRIYSAMKCRGFSGSYPAPAQEKINARDIFCLLTVCGLVVLFRCLS